MAGVFSLLGLEASAAETLPGLRVYTHREKVWRDTMGKEDRLVFAREAGDLLIELGYERNDGWVHGSSEGQEESRGFKVGGV
jgi:hypothetical protein